MVNLIPLEQQLKNAENELAALDRHASIDQCSQERLDRARELVVRLRAELAGPSRGV